MREHLERCESCEGELGQLRALFHTIESLPDESLGRDLVPDVLAALEELNEPTPSPEPQDAAGIRPNWLSPLAVGELVLALALATAMLLWLGTTQLTERLSGLAERILLQIDAVTANLLSAVNEGLGLLEPAVIAELGEVATSIFLSPWMWWAIALSAITLWAVGNGLVLRRVRRGE